MANPEAVALNQARQDYNDALAALQQPDWPAEHAPADPYGRAFLLADGDLVVTRGSEGQRDLAFVAGKPELAQGLLVLIGTPLGTDIFNQRFGFDIFRTLIQPKGVREMRELVRLCVVKAIALEPRVQQIQAIAFVDEKAYLRIHPDITAQQQQALAQEQRVTRRWKLDVLLDTTLGDQLTAAVSGVGP